MNQIHLTGTARAVAAVTSALQDVAPLPACIVWRLRERQGDVEIVGDGRTTVASSWEKAVRLHLFPRVGAVRVGPL